MKKLTMFEPLKRFRNSQFIKSSLVLFYGNALAQLVFICALPFLTRIYTPAMFGGFGFVLVVSTLLGGIASLRFEEALVISQPGEEKTLLQLCFFTALTIALASGLLAYLFFEMIEASTRQGISRSTFATMIFLGVVITALGNSLQNYFVKRAYFKSISAVQLGRSVITVGLQFMLYSYGAIGLIGGNIAGLLSAFILMLVITLRSNTVDKEIFSPARFFIADVSLVTMGRLFRRYKDFPLYDMPNTLLNALAQASPVFLLMTFSGAVAVGAYTLIIRVLQKPVELITKPVRLVFYKKASDVSKANPQELQSLFRIVTASLGLLSLIPSFLIFLNGPELFVWVFGEEWSLAGEYSKWVVIWVGVRIMNVPTTTMVKVLRKQDKMLIYSATLSIVSIVALTISTVYFGALVGIAVFSLTGALGNLLLIFWMDNLLRNEY